MRTRQLYTLSLHDALPIFLMIKSNDLSSYTVITTGNTFPALSCVLELNCLQNSMMLTPFAPSAGPTGGEGFAAPPLICNRSEEHTSELQSRPHLVCRLLLE